MTDRSFSPDEHDDDLIPTPEADGRDHFFAPEVARVANGEVVGPQLLVLPHGCTRGEAIAHLSKDIPHSHYGLPDYFIRSDLLHLTESISQEDVDAASMGLSYSEGYPTLQDGRSFWSQLPHEPQQAFNHFTRYLEQAQEEGIRQLDLLSVAMGVDGNQLRQLYLEFYWSSRARAYDLFVVAAEERKRQLRIRKMEGKHFDVAQQRIDELLNKFSAEEDNWWEELNAKEAVEALIELAKLQRLSLGLTGQNASSMPKTAIPEGASPEVIMEHLTRGANMSQASASNFGQRLSALLESDDGAYVQDAIIRLTRPADAPNNLFGADD